LKHVDKANIYERKKFIFRLSARQKYNDGFITKWPPVTTFRYRNDFDPKIKREKRK
jgi:hypothetical protein